MCCPLYVPAVARRSVSDRTDEWRALYRPVTSARSWVGGCGSPEAPAVVHSWN